MRNELQSKTLSKEATFIVWILIFITVLIFLGTIQEISGIIKLGPVQEIEAGDGRLELISENHGIKIGGFPLADITAPTHRTTPANLNLRTILSGQVILSCLSSLALIAATLSLAYYFYLVSREQTLIFSRAYVYFRRASLALLIRHILLPIISYLFYQASISNSSLNLGTLLINFGVVLFLELFGRILKESSELKQEAEQFI